MRFFNLDRLRRIGDDVERGWPGYLLGGRIRTSTVVLIVAFAALWWIYDEQRASTRSTPTQVPATEVVPPGFVPDPSYTWVPRSRVQEPPTTVTVTQTPITTPPTTTTTTTPPPPFNLPTIVLPPPFGPPVTTPTGPPPPGQPPTPPPLPPLPGLP
ncbi:MAG: hypothetical protein WAN71_01020, partial [Mycobacterium sp.]|uniref:hypothetical protein n=1 Tax=Mycobacterium sp. TaxID=1785 RepID=UPI003BB109A3